MAMEDEVCVDTPEHEDLCVEWNERPSQHYLNMQGFDTCICVMLAKSRIKSLQNTVLGGSDAHS